MLHVTIQNSICQVNNSTPKIDNDLGELLQYTDNNAEFAFNDTLREIQNIERKWRQAKATPEGDDLKRLKQLRWMLNNLDKTKTIYLYKNNQFLTGLLPRVLDYLKDNSIPHTVIDQRIKPKLNTEKLVPLKPFPQLRPYQKRAVKAALEKHRGVVVHATGTGKSTILCKLIDELRVPALIITPSKNITNMLYKTLVSYYGKGKVTKLTTKSTKISPICIVCVHSCIKLKPSLLQSQVAVFIDEFHHSSADTYISVNKEHLANCYYKIGLTATNFRADGSDLALEGVLSEVIDTYDTRTAIREGYLVPPQFEIISNQNTQLGNYQTQYRNGVVNSRDRNKIIRNIVAEYPNRHILILVKEIQHGHNLQQLIPGSVFINGTEKDSLIEKTMKDFACGKLKILIGSAIIGEGVDLPIADMLILASGGKSAIQVIQNIGRVLRPYPGKEDALVFDFEDIGAKYLNRHALERQSIYQSYLEE